MKKYLSFVLLSCAAVCCALDLPKTSVAPHVNTTDIAQWAKVANKAAGVQYSAVYDEKNLYIIAEIDQKEAIYAGDGRGFADYNDGVEIRINRGKKHGFLQIWVDAAGQIYVCDAYRPASRGGIQADAVRTPGKGFRIFAAIPWQRLHTKDAKPARMRVAVLRIKVKKPFKYERTTIVDNLEPQDKVIAFEPGKVLARQEKVLPVRNFGRSGHSTSEILRQLPVIFDYEPKLFILMIGTNDVVYKKKWQTPEQFSGHYRKICEKLRDYKCKVILITIPPCVENVANRHIRANAAEKAQLNNRIRKMNEYIKNYAGEFGFPVLDYHKFFTGDLEAASSLMRVPANKGGYDGIHPNEEGYKLLAGELKKLIDQHKYPTSGIICVGDSITYGAHMKAQGSVYGDTYPAQLLKLLKSK